MIGKIIGDDSQRFREQCQVFYIVDFAGGQKQIDHSCPLGRLVRPGKEAAQNIAMFYSFFATCTKKTSPLRNGYATSSIIINDTKTSKVKDLLPQFIDKNLLLYDSDGGVDSDEPDCEKYFYRLEMNK